MFWKLVETQCDFNCAKIPKQIPFDREWIQGAPEILPMIDASSSNVLRRASGCQAIMGHHVGLRGRESIERYRNGTTGSCSLRTAGIATLSINHRSMTGTCSVSHEFDSSNLYFVVRWARILLSRPETTSGSLWLDGATAMGFLTGRGVEAGSKIDIMRQIIQLKIISF